METDYQTLTRELRVLGPPGTGKTTFLAREIAHLAEQYGADNLIVASYTRAAAAQLVMQDLNIPRDSVGTLHALCYRALGSPELAEKHIPDFNAANPRFKLTASTGGGLDEGADDAVYITNADKMFAEYRLQRARMLPLQKLQSHTIEFLKAWESWKGDNKYIDFTDMIDFTLKFKSPPPGNKEVGVYDEVQDFNALEIAVVRMWAKYQKVCILAGDDDQALYGFCGADSNAFLNPPVPDNQKRVLSQSWRVPRTVQALANNWIINVVNRESKLYKPRDVEGEVRRIGARHNYPQPVIEDAQKYLEAGKTVMFLTSCGYMLNGFKKVLRSEGIPFHNPFRKTRGDWNPLGSFGHRSSKMHSAKDRLISFLNDKNIVHEGQPYWSLEDMALWTDLISAKGILKHGAKKRIEDQAEFPTLHTPPEIAAFHHECFEEYALKAALTRDLRWFQDSLAPSKRDVMEFPIEVLKRRGPEALTKEPQVIISTIHGVKGGESDCVYLFPDMSIQGMREWSRRGDGHDAVTRMFYVGMTRARESLVLCGPSSSAFVQM